MKIENIDRVNHLIAELNGMKELIAHAERADATDFELLIKLAGDASIRMSSEGSETSHDRGFAASPEFLERLKRLAIEELDARRRGIVAELTTLGVEADQ